MSQKLISTMLSGKEVYSDKAAEMVKKELALDIPHFPDADYKHLETPRSRRKLRWRPKKKD